DFHERLAGSLAHADSLRIDVGERLGVLLGPNADRAVDRFVFPDRKRADVLELLITGVLQENLAKLLRIHAHEWMPTRGNHLAVTLGNQRLRERWGADPD